VMLTCSFCSFMQAALEPADGEKWLHFFSVQCGVGRLSTARCPGCCSLILNDALSSAFWEKKRKREREKEKKRKKK
jgi:hypothetical protein